MAKKKKKLKEYSVHTLFGMYLTPRHLKEDLSYHMAFMGWQKFPYAAIAFLFYFLLLVSAVAAAGIAYVLWEYIGAVLSVFIAVPSFFLVFFMSWKMSFFMYRFLFNSVYNKRMREIDALLPDFLTELNMHLRSGVTLKSALEDSIKPELGYVNKILKEMIRDINLGYEIEVAFRNVTKVNKCKTIKKEIKLYRA